jgi:hypothetical protein
MTEIDGVSKRVVELLELNGHDSVATSLRAELDSLSSTDVTRSADAAAKLQQMCNVRWLGDLYVKDMSQQEWWNLLSKLKRYARRHVKS